MSTTKRLNRTTFRTSREMDFFSEKELVTQTGHEIQEWPLVVIKELIDKYAVNFDPKVRDEVVARYKKLNLPTYWAGVNPEISPTFDRRGKITSAQMSYPRDFMGQRLRFSAMYEPSLLKKKGH